MRSNAFYFQLPSVNCRILEGLLPVSCFTVYFFLVNEAMLTSTRIGLDLGGVFRPQFEEN